MMKRRAIANLGPLPEDPPPWVFPWATGSPILPFLFSLAIRLSDHRWVFLSPSPRPPTGRQTEAPMVPVSCVTLFQTSDGPTARTTEGPIFLCHPLPDRRTDRPIHRRSHFLMSPSARPPTDRPTDPPKVPFSHVTHPLPDLRRTDRRIHRKFNFLMGPSPRPPTDRQTDRPNNRWSFSRFINSNFVCQKT